MKYYEAKWKTKDGLLYMDIILAASLEEAEAVAHKNHPEDEILYVRQSFRYESN